MGDPSFPQLRGGNPKPILRELRNRGVAYGPLATSGSTCRESCGSVDKNKGALLLSNYNSAMSDPVTRNINASVQETFEWLKDVEEALGTDDRQIAYHALRAVLHALRDRLIGEEACDLAAQLPTVLRGIYFEGWSPAHKPIKMSKAQFLDRVASQLGETVCELDSARCVSAVFGVLQDRIAMGEVLDICGCLPEEFEDLWRTAGRADHTMGLERS